MKLETRLEAALVNIETKIWDATRGKQHYQLLPQDLEKVDRAQRPFIEEAVRERKRGNYEIEAALFNELATGLSIIGLDCEKKGNPTGAQLAYSWAAKAHGFSAGAYSLGADTLNAKLHQLKPEEKDASLLEIDRLYALKATENGSQAAFFFLIGEMQKAEDALKNGAGAKAKNSETIALYNFADVIFAKEAEQEKRAATTVVSAFPMLVKGLMMLEGITNATVFLNPGGPLNQSVIGKPFLVMGEEKIPLPVSKYRTEEKE